MKKIQNKLTSYKNWSIATKYLFGQIVSIIFILLLGYLPLTILVRNMLENTIEEVMKQTSKAASVYIESTLDYTTESWVIHTTSPYINQTLRQSNEEWNAVSNKDALIEQRDNIWKSDSVQKLQDYPVWVNELLNNGLSQEFTRLMSNYNTEQGSQDVAEIIVTNKYGVNVASTGLTTDYYQADEFWWQQAVENRTYVSDLVYDESLGTESIEIGIKINDDSGQLLGVTKIVIKTEFLFAEVQNLMLAMEQRASIWCGECEGLNVRFYDKQKNIIYQLKKSNQVEKKELEVVEKILAGEITEAKEKSSKYKQDHSLTGSDNVLLFLHRGENGGGMGGVTVFEYNKDETFTKVRKAETAILITFVGVFIGAFVYSVFTVKKITSPILELTNVAKSFGEGDKKIRSSVKTNDEVGELSKTFNKMADSLMEIDESKTEFLSLASHQLRTPLGVISWHLEMLKKGDFGEIPNQVSYALDDVIEKNNYLKKLVKDLLNVTRIEQNRIPNKPDKTNVFKLTKKVINGWSGEAEKRKVKIIEKLDPNLTEVYIDAEKYEQIVDNLMSNSVKYSNGGGRVWVELEKQKNSFTLTIRDEGVGIPKEDLEKIPNKFFRGSNTVKTETDGTGLGLYIVSRYIKVMDGEFNIESELNSGTKVTVSFPNK